MPDGWNWRYCDVNLYMSRTINMPTDHVSHRYEERDSRFTLRSWGIDPTLTNLEGPLDERPVWLVNIVNTALLAGEAQRPKIQPPDLILWFRTDAENRFLCFEPDFTNQL